MCATLQDLRRWTGAGDVGTPNLPPENTPPNRSKAFAHEHKNRNNGESLIFQTDGRAEYIEALRTANGYEFGLLLNSLGFHKAKEDMFMLRHSSS